MPGWAVTGLAWKINRLRAMGWREIAHRGGRLIAGKITRRAIEAGRVPVPGAPVRPRLTLFPDLPQWRDAWARNFQIDAAALELLVQGKLDLFGHAPLDVGNPVDWHRDPVTGIRAPLTYGKALNYRDDALVGNIKFTWELGRHQHLIPLAAAYACSGERRYRDAVVGQVDGWIDSNPCGMGIHWCSALEVALRLIAWAVVHSLLALRDGAAGLFGAVVDADRLGTVIYQQAHFVRHYLSRYSSANNHLIGELTGLWVACQVFDMGPDGARWANLAQRELEREAELQIHGDGVDKEQAFYYHLWVLEYLLFAGLVGERADRLFTAEFRRRIAAMAGFLRAVTPPGGEPSQVGDADDGCVTRFEAAWPRSPYRDVLVATDWVVGERLESGDGLPQKAFWYAMAHGKLSERAGQKPAAGVVQATYPKLYPEGGYAILGGGGLHVLVDAGPLGYPSIAAHGHADALSLCLALDGAWWLVDPGTYAYHSDPRWRNYFRGTAAHNTVVVDGCDQSDIGGPFLWTRHARATLESHGEDATAGQWVVASHDGYARRGALHRRRVEVHPDNRRVRVIDAVLGNGEHALDVHFHFAPDVMLAADPEGGGWIASKSGAQSLLMIATDDAWQWETVRGNEMPVLGWYSPALGVKVPAYTLRGRWRGDIPAHLTTTISVQAADR